MLSSEEASRLLRGNAMPNRPSETQDPITIDQAVWNDKPTIRRKRFTVQLTLVLLLLLVAPAAADTLLTYTRTTPEFSFDGRTAGGRETVRILIGTDRVRLEEPR